MRAERPFVVGRRRPNRDIDTAVADVERRLRAEGSTVQAAVVDHKREVRASTTKAIKHGSDLVVVVGGDGTIVQVADSLAGTEVPMAIVPTGTGNLLARNLGVSGSVDDAIRIALGGRRRTIDLGRVAVGRKKARCFTVACGLGFDADVMDRTDGDSKGRWGTLAYLASALLETPKIHDVRHRLTIDGVRSTADAAQVLIANFGRVPPGIRVRGVRADDGLLDVFVVQATGPVPALLAGWEAITSTRPGVANGGRVFRAQARSVRIDTTPHRKVEADGSILGRTPIKVTIDPKALVVMVPSVTRGRRQGRDGAES
jgi:YegS/Rv2252/BmrU family lipid kinase